MLARIIEITGGSNPHGLSRNTFMFSINLKKSADSTWIFDNENYYGLLYIQKHEKFGTVQKLKKVHFFCLVFLKFGVYLICLTNGSNL